MEAFIPGTNAVEATEGFLMFLVMTGGLDESRMIILGAITSSQLTTDATFGRLLDMIIAMREK